MKQAYHMLVVLLLLAVSFSSATAQDEPEALGNFSVKRGDGQATIYWTIRAGFSCSDVKVEHSTDGENFTGIYTYPGICGATETSQSYSFEHKQPVTGELNYYRLNLERQGFSEVEVVRIIDFDAQSYSIFPMPATTASVLYFRNSSIYPFQLTIADVSGRVVFLKQNITESEIRLAEARLSRGAYFFMLTNGNERHSGKIISQ